MKTKNGRRVMTVAGDVMLSLEENAPTVLAGSVKRHQSGCYWDAIPIIGGMTLHKNREKAAVILAEAYERAHDLGPIKSVDDLADEESARGDEADAEAYADRVRNALRVEGYDVKTASTASRASKNAYLAGRRSR